MMLMFRDEFCINYIYKNIASDAWEFRALNCAQNFENSKMLSRIIYLHAACKKT